MAPQYYYTVRTAEVLVNQFAKVGIPAKIRQIDWASGSPRCSVSHPCVLPSSCWGSERV